MSAVAGLHADDGDDDLGRHPVFTLGARQRRGIAPPVVQAAPDALTGEEDAAVLAPVEALLGRAGDGVQDGLATVRPGQDGGQRAGIEAVLLDHARDEPLLQGLGRGGAQRHGGQQGGEQDQQVFHRGNSFRWVWIDIRIPKPAIRVTSEVPP